MGKSYGFSAVRFNQIIIFDDERDFKAVVAANPYMTAIMGGDDYTRENYPGLYIAGVTANLPLDNTEGRPPATRK